MTARAGLLGAKPNILEFVQDGVWSDGCNAYGYQVGIFGRVEGENSFAPIKDFPAKALCFSAWRGVGYENRAGQSGHEAVTLNRALLRGVRRTRLASCPSPCSLPLAARRRVGLVDTL